MRTPLVLAMALAGAVGQAEPRAFVGTWTADLAGRTYVRLELHETSGTLGGVLGLGDIHVDAQGAVDDVIKVAGDPTPIIDAVFRDGELSFARKDGNDKDLFLARRVGDALQLNFVLTAEDRRQLTEAGIPIPKPIPLKRVER